MMTPVDKSKGAAKNRKAPESMAPPVKAPAEPPVDYSKLLGSEKDIPKTAKKGRGPTPHYIGTIRAFQDSGKEESPIMVEEFRRLMNKPGLKIESIRQGFRTTLQDERYADANGVKLWDSIQVSIYADRDHPDDPEKSTITLKRRDANSGRRD